MAITTQSYFSALRDYLNTREYQVREVERGMVELKDKFDVPGRRTPLEHKVKLSIPGEALVINLDLKNNRGSSDPLFHFLEDESKPWAKRCDFIVFHMYRNRIESFCIEFKSGSFPITLQDQLNSGAAWCRSLHSIIKHYTGKTKRMRIMKFVFSSFEDEERRMKFLDEAGKYIKRDHSIRHYLYTEVDGLSIANLENEHVETIG